eukprot:11020238-Alexandrium_andersonii.AAC.1
MCDANSRFEWTAASPLDFPIGHGAHCMRTFVDELELCVPLCQHELRKGQSRFTWYPVSGPPHTIDYVCCDPALQSACDRAHADQQIDLSLAKVDHIVSMALFRV